MAFYHNSTRFAAIITLKVVVAQDLEKVLEIGSPSRMRSGGKIDLGIHDILVGPDESIEVMQGADVQFIAARTSP